MSIAKKTKKLIREKRYNEAFNINLGLAIRIARKFSYKGNLMGMTSLDLEQEAFVALWTAVGLYEESKGYFSTFASIVIRNHMIKLFETKKPVLSTQDYTPQILETHRRGTERDYDLDDRAMVAEIVDELEELTELQKKAIVGYCKDLNNADIGRIERCSPQNVQQARKRGMEMIKQKLNIP